MSEDKKKYWFIKAESVPWTFYKDDISLFGLYKTMVCISDWDKEGDDRNERTRTWLKGMCSEGKGVVDVVRGRKGGYWTLTLTKCYDEALKETANMSFNARSKYWRILETGTVILRFSRNVTAGQTIFKVDSELSLNNPDGTKFRYRYPTLGHWWNLSGKHSEDEHAQQLYLEGMGDTDFETRQ